ncbi:MAG: NUDIX hydrolase [Planctomycetota bacterium]|nr:NUDIX hydrolase [Planctomycetota bacterium]
MKIQSAVVPYRFIDDELQILLITSRRTGHWGIPKGNLEAQMSPAQSAAKEAYEEGGVIGSVLSEIIGSYDYQKLNNDYHVDVFLLQVEDTLHNWPERISRRRAWVSQEVACKKVHNKGIVALLKSLDPARCPRLTKAEASSGRLWQPGSASLCFDFDDTLCQHNGEPIPGARDFAHECAKKGYQLSLSSARFAPLYGELNDARMAKVKRWLSDHDFPDIPVSYKVPPADIYLDDKAWNFQSPWPDCVSQIKGHFGIRPYRRAEKTVSLSLQGTLADEAGTLIPEAGEQVHQLSKMGMKVNICLGLFDPDSPDEQRVGKAIDWLDSRHIPFHKVSAAKLASDLYISPNSFRFEGSWSALGAKVHSLLDNKPNVD